MKDLKELKGLQELPLSRKVGITQARIADWYNRYGGRVYLSLSHGDSSRILMSIVSKMYPQLLFLKEKEGYKPITDSMIEDSEEKQKFWIQYGCNAFEAEEPVSNPLSHWNNKDVLEYIKIFKLDEI